MANFIKQIQLGESNYDIAAKFLQDSDGNNKQWSDIVKLIDAGIQLVVDTPAGEDNHPSTTASAQTMGKIYLVTDSSRALSGTYVEWITVQQEDAYKWEKIGTTEADLTDYVKKGEHVSAAQANGAHTHEITGSVTIPTVSKTSKKLAATAKGVGVAVDGTARAITGFGSHTTKKALGENATFSISGGKATTTNIAATASGAAVDANGTASAVTNLGTPTTANVVTGYAAPTTKDVVTGYSKPGTAEVLGSTSSVSVSGGKASTTHVQATASGATVSTGDDTFVKSYPGATTKLVTESITPVNGTATVPSSVSVSAGSAASWSANVLDGVLSFSFSANKPTSVSVGDGVAVAKAGSAKTVVTGVSSSGNGDTIMTGLGDPVTAKALTSASVSQPTIKLSAASAGNSNTIDLVSGVSDINASLIKNNVNVLTGLGAPSTVAALTGLGTPSTAAVVTGYNSPSKTSVLTGVKMTAQPTIKLAEVKDSSDNTVAVATGVTGLNVSVSDTDAVDAITGLGIPTTATVATSVKVTSQPTITLNGNADDGIDYVDTVSIGSKSGSITGTAASAGAHGHNISL